MVEGIIRSEEIKGRHGLMVKTSPSESYLRIERKIRKARSVRATAESDLVDF